MLSDRRPAWLDGWVEHINNVQARSSSRSEQTWPFTRHLIEAGLCERPATDAYVLNMIRGIHYEAFDSRARWQSERERYQEVYDAWLERLRARSVIDRLRNEPDLLERDVWDLFRVRGRPSRMLTPIGKGAVADKLKRSKRYWGPALVELACEGRISRDRLIHETLEALARNFPPGQLRWLIELHELLQVSPSERSAQHEDYLHLLSAADANVVKFAVAELTSAIDAGEVEMASVLCELDPVLLTAPAVTAVAAVKLIDRIIVKSPHLRTPGVEALLTALSHVQPRVQNAAAATICKRWDSACDGLASTVHSHAAFVSEPARGRLLALL